VVSSHRRGLTRASVLTLAFAVASACFPTSAGAQSTQDKIDRTRAEIDETAQEWFDHQTDAQQLADEIAQLEQRVAADKDHAARVADVARDRAVEIYIGGDDNLAGVLDANDALDSARRAELIDRATADGQQAIAELNDVTADLDEQRAELEARKAEQDSLSAQLKEQQAELEEQLRTLQAQASREAEAARAAAAAKAKQQAAAASATAAKAAPRRGAPTSSPPPSAAVDAPAPGAQAAPVASSGGAHRDDPFLACTRARESGGNYGAVNSSGYYGAYQFSKSTWNITASHAGRIDLVGVVPSQAAPADQDELAWVLYEWQGTRPWGGRC
jgi:peptidoglycan hydrolase CwlO-like protein